jgi:hypothetical protein
MTDKDVMLASCDEKIMGESATVAGAIVTYQYGFPPGQVLARVEACFALLCVETVRTRK